MTQATSTRIYLSVPFSDKGDATRSGAHWCPEHGRWWIDRRDIGAYPGIYRWIADNPMLKAKAKEAFDFLHGKRRGQSPKGNGSNPKARTPRH